MFCLSLTAPSPVLVFFKQASVVNELKSWCMAKLQNIEVRFNRDPSLGLLKHSSSMEEGLCEVHPAGVTVLPAGPGGSTHCLAPAAPEGLGPEEGGPSGGTSEEGSANHYFVIHVDTSPGTVQT